MANDPISIDSSLQIPVTGQPTVGVSPYQRAPQARPVTLQDLSQYLSNPQQRQAQSAAANQQPQQRGQQTQRGGRAPASVRYNNPGAMWPGPSSRKFGGSDYGVLRDGNLIAKFDDPVNGAAAQFDLLDSKKYVNRPIGSLIGEWSGYTGGSKNVDSYAASVANSVGLSPDDRLTPQLLRSPAGIAFAKAQARMETGYDYPLTDDQWKQAQGLAFGGGKQQPATQQIAATDTGGPQLQDLSQYLASSSASSSQ